jgi:tRNA U34 5-carboxymethylaminomethyl modifying GTPase MnmE/TrmE
MKKFLLILYLTFLPEILNSTNEEKSILLIGPLRSGKSCFVNSILGRNLAIVGDDDGEQTTQVSFPYQGKIDDLDLKLRIIDTAPLTNNNYSYLFDIIKDQSEYTGKQGIDLILLFSSLRDENPSLKFDLEKIKFFLNEMKGVSLIVTKTSGLGAQKKLTKLENISKISHTFGLNENLIEFNSDCSGSWDIDLAKKINTILKSRSRSTIYSKDFLTSRIYDIENQIKFMDSQKDMLLDNKLKMLSSSNQEKYSQELNELFYFEFFKILIAILVFLSVSIVSLKNIFLKNKQSIYKSNDEKNEKNDNPQKIN